MKVIKSSDLLEFDDKLAIEELKRDSYFDSPMHYHEHYELYYLKSKDRRYIINDKTFNINQGEIVLIAPYEMHRTGFLKDHNYNRILINFKNNLFTEDEKLLLYCFNIHKCVLINQYEVEKLIYLIKQELDEKRTCYELYAKALLIQLLVLINRHCNALDSMPKIEKRASKISEMLKFISENYENKITLSDLSSQFSQIGRAHV